MRRFLFTFLSLLGLVATLGAQPSSERGLPFVQAFRPHDYGDEHNQTWSAVQDRQGVLFVGNRDVVLAYDGFAWRSLRVGGIFVRGLAIDANDRIWVGAVNELGYLENDGHGGRTFVSVRDQLPAAERDFGNLFQVFALSHGVYFVGSDRILRWHNGRFTVEHLAGRPLVSVVGDELIVHARNQPLMAWRGATRRIVADAPELRRDNGWVIFVAPQPDGTWLLGTVRDGFWRLAGKTLTRFPTAADAILRAGSIARGLQLRDGTLAVAVRPGGLLLLDPQGAVRHFLDSNNGGLPNSGLHGLFQDRDGDVWAMLDLGLARITWPGHATLFFGANGLDHGTIHAVTRHAGTLYVGAFEGLFALQPADPQPTPPREARFVPVPGFPDDVLSLASAGDELLVGGGDGLRVRSADGKVTRAMPSGRACFCVLVPRGDSRLAYAGVSNGLVQLRREPEGWKITDTIVEASTEEIRHVVEAPDGALWASSADHGFYRILGLPGTASATAGPPRIEQFVSGHGLGPTPIADLPVVVATTGDPLFLIAERLYRFNSATNEFAALALPVPPDTRVRGVGPGLAGNVWLRLERNFNVDDATHRDNHIARLSPQGEVDFLPVSLAQAAGQSLSFLEEPGAAAGSILWTGGTEANLLRVAVPGGMVSPATFHATIRRVSQPGGERLSLATASPARLSYASRALNFTFATDRLEHDGTQFQVRLDDQRNWSEPLSSPAFPLTGTSAGRHVLAVRARDRDGRLSEPAEFAFVVLAPWWQTWWAVGSYVVLFVVVIVGFVKWRLRAVRRRNDELESLIATRTRELEVAKLGAEAASQAKSAFLANMSHELRTPLNAILGYAQILRKDTGLTPKGQRQLEIVGRNGEHLLQMINEVLDLAKIEAGKMTLHAVEFPLTRVVKSAADLLEQRAADKGLGFRLELGANLPRLVSSDEQKLRQVLLNLLGNAVKFTAHGEIVLAATRLNGHVRFEVRDTGPGIAADQLAAIFQPFHQAVPASAAAQGTGLGLAISQRIVALLSGKIEVASVVGRGSRFWFDLPLPELRATAPRNPAIRTVTGYRGPRRRILVTDDEPTNRAVLRDLLEPLGFVVEEAVDGAACLAAVSVRAPDALLLDLRMPVLGGLEVVPRLRAMSALSSLPIIAVSASVLGFHQDDAIAAGCDGFVAKPVQEAQLLDALGRVLRLEWIYRETPAPGESATAFPETAGAPTRAEITAMIEFARDGDLAALRDWIAQALARGTAAAAFLGQVDELAAGFKMAEIRQCLDSAAAQLDQNSP